MTISKLLLIYLSCALFQVMEHVAVVLGMDSAAVKAANFLPDDDNSSAGINTISSNMGRLCIASPAAAESKQQQQLLQQRLVNKQLVGVTTVLGRFISSDTYTLPLLWQQLLSSSQYSKRLAAVKQYNRDQAWSKRGIVITPVRWDTCTQPTGQDLATPSSVVRFCTLSLLLVGGGSAGWMRIKCKVIFSRCCTSGPAAIAADQSPVSSPSV